MDRDSKKRRVLSALSTVRHVNRSVVVQIVRCLEPDNDDLDPKQLYRDLSKATKRLTTDLIYNITVEPVDPGGPTTVALSRVQDLLLHVLTHLSTVRHVNRSVVVQIVRCLEQRFSAGFASTCSAAYPLYIFSGLPAFTCSAAYPLYIFSGLPAFICSAAYPLYMFSGLPAIICSADYSLPFLSGLPAIRFLRVLSGELPATFQRP